MKYMLLIYNDPTSWPDDPAAGEKMMQEYGAFTEAILASGEMVAGDPLQGIDTATSVRVRDGKTTTTDGPFAETKEQLGGYYLIEVPNLDAAIGWARRIPTRGAGSVEVRPVVER